MENKIKLFEDMRIRYAWDAEREEWFFSIADVVKALTDSADEKQYLKKMKMRDPSLEANWGTICTLVQMVGMDGKRRKIQAADAKGILRLIQSIPSPKAEPFKMWLAQVGAERVDEIADPEKAILRGAEYYRAKGYTEGWINQRLQAIEMRKELTDEWKARGIEDERDYAILTNDQTKIEEATKQLEAAEEALQAFILDKERRVRIEEDAEHEMMGPEDVGKDAEESKEETEDESSEEEKAEDEEKAE